MRRTFGERGGELSFLAVYFLVLGLAQLGCARLELAGLSAAGPWRGLNNVVGVALVVGGCLMMPPAFGVFLYVVPATLLALLTSVILGSLTSNHLRPDRSLSPGFWPDWRCERFDIPNGISFIPALLFTPHEHRDSVICVAHGSGDSKTGFKWRLFDMLLQRGFVVLTVDLAGHGENQAAQRWPDCIAELPVVLDWLRQTVPCRHVFLLGISMGGALSAHAASQCQLDGLVLCETPLEVTYSRQLVWREAWDSLRSPIIDLLRDISPWQIWKRWQVPVGRREIGLGDLIRRLDVPARLAEIVNPVFLVYGGRDHIAPVSQAKRLLNAAPDKGHRLLVASEASHLALTQMPSVNAAIADWLVEQERPAI